MVPVETLTVAAIDTLATANINTTRRVRFQALNTLDRTCVNGTCPCAKVNVMPYPPEVGSAATQTDRDPLAEERTLLANERTYSGWVRTALACEGVGLGFHAVMRNTQPAWLPEVAAGIFIVTGILLILFAHQRARHILLRLEEHGTPMLPPARLGWLTAALVFASVGLAVVLWFVR